MILTWWLTIQKPQVKWAGIKRPNKYPENQQPKPRLRKDLLFSPVPKTSTPTCLSTWEPHQESHLSFGIQMNSKVAKTFSSASAYMTMALMTRWPTISTSWSGPSTFSSLKASSTKVITWTVWNRVQNWCSRLCSSSKMNFQKLSPNSMNQPLKMKKISRKQKSSIESRRDLAEIFQRTGWTSSC